MKIDSRNPIRSCAPGGAAVLLAAVLFGASPARADDAPASGDSTVVGTPSNLAPPVAAPAPSSVVPEVAAPAPATNALLIVKSKRVRLMGKDNVVRSGPGNQYSIAGVYPRDQTFTVIAKSGEWYNLRLSDTETAWVHSSLCHELDDLSGLEFKPNPKIYTRTGTYVLGAYAGAYAFDRKSNSLVLGGRMSYYVFDRFQAEAGVSWTHVNRAPEIVESLFGLSLESENFQMLFYQMNVTWEVLPGRQMVPFLTGGAGSTVFQGRAETSINFGAGTRLFLSKRTAMRWEVRDYRFNSGSDSGHLVNDNIEFTLGTEHLF